MGRRAKNLLHFSFSSLNLTVPCMKSTAQCPDKLSIFKSEAEKGASLKSDVFKLLAMKTHSLKRSKLQNVTDFLGGGKKIHFLKALRTTKGAWVCAEQHQATCTWIKETVNKMSWFFLGSTQVNKWLQRIRAWVLFSLIGITKLMSKQ